MSSLAASLAHFTAAYRNNRALVAEQRGWTKVIALVASDSGEAAAVLLEDGEVVGIEAGRRAGDIVVTADLITLRDILELRRSPNEPYLFGDLTVKGPEADFLRLDYIATVLCPT